jgi:hypothetical protein
VEIRVYTDEEEFDSYYFSSLEEYRIAVREILYDSETSIYEETYEMEILIVSGDDLIKERVVTKNLSRYLDNWLLLVQRYYPLRDESKRKINVIGNTYSVSAIPRVDENLTVNNCHYVVTGLEHNPRNYSSSRRSFSYIH